MIMIKATKNKKKLVVNVKAPAPAPAQTVPVQPAAPVVALAPTKPVAPPPSGVALELVEPAAKQVFVAGSFNGWKPEVTPLASQGNGRWKGDLRLSPGRHEYLFVVDGHWLPDPNARESVANPFGGRNSVITVSR